MATVYVTVGTVGTSGDLGSASAFKGDTGRSEVITSSGTSERGAIQGIRGEFAQVFCETPVYVRSGEVGAVTVSASNGVFIPGNSPTYISLSQGQVVAVIDV